MIKQDYMQNWTPIITDLDRKKKAEIIIDHISTYLNLNESKHDDLMYGHVGIGVYYGYQFFASKKEKHIERCISLIEKSIDSSSNSFVTNFAFGNGIMGNLWGIGHLISIGIIDATIEDLVDEHTISKALQYSKDAVSRGDYDYLLGGLGAILLLHNVLDKASMKYVKEINEILLLQAKVEASNQTTFWYQSPVLSKPDHSDDRINMGLAHGLPSIILLLSHLRTSGINIKRNEEFIDSCAAWMVSKKNSCETFSSYFPYSFDSKNGDTPSGLRWCYGDLGVAISFYLVGKSIQKDNLINFGLEVALSCATRSFNLNLLESHLCHGSAGVAHIFSRFFNYTKNAIFREAALYWYDQTFLNFNPDLRSGFKVWKGTDSDWIEFDGLLEGSAGIGLALISAISDIEPKWDRCLLLS
jgi:lantibiotic modifying enzyme